MILELSYILALKFDTDSITLAERVKELTEEFDLKDLVSTLPYNETEIDNFSKLTDFNWDQYIEEDLSDTFSDTKFDKTITVKVTNETYHWQIAHRHFPDRLLIPGPGTQFGTGV